MNETTTYVSIEEVLQYATLHALADRERQHGSVALTEIVVERIAHQYDLKVEDIEVTAVDRMVQPKGTSWGMDVIWWVPCNECELEVDVNDLTAFSPPMCAFHTAEALEQEQADLENDDIASGMRN
jgi:hypothetical protein